MASARPSILGHLQRLAQCQPAGALTDTELLRRYRSHGDEAAFEALVWRHAGMVLGVCRRVLRGDQDAEDAFQATFLAFARATGAIDGGDSVGGWLYRVAGRIARKAGARAAKQRVQPLADVAQADGDPAVHAAQRDLRSVLDEEVGRLPAKERVPFVLCYLEGRTNAEAARELGWPTGTVATRLAGARQRLRARLTRRGLAVPAALAAVGIGDAALAASAPVPLVLVTIRNALAFAHGSAAMSLVSKPVVTLAKGALRNMLLTRIGFVAAALVAVGLIVTAAATAAGHFLDEPPPAAQAPVHAQAVAPKPATGPVAAKPASSRLLIYRQGHLTLIDADGKNEKKVSQDRAKFHPGTARLSPNGKRIAFLVQSPQTPPPANNPRRKVYVRALDEAEPGTDLGVEAQAVCWSPDGKYLAVTDTQGDDPKSETCVSWLVDVKTKEKTALKLPDSHMVTDWSHDGRFLLTTELDVRAKEPVVRLHLIRRDGSEDRRLAGGMAAFGRLSPDGSRVLCMAPDPQRAGKDKQDSFGLFVLDIGKAKLSRVEGQPLNGELMGYCWSPDGKRIAYTWRQTDAPAGQQTESYLVVADPDGSNAATIASERGDSRGLITLGDPDWR
jgi:RNA polymerase sigma factor (sigma-70 family)